MGALIPANFDAGLGYNQALAQIPVRNQALYGEGLQTGQQAAVLGALGNIDVNDPTGQSLNNGIGALVRHGALDQAGALVNLGITRQIAPMVPGILQKLNHLGEQQSSDATPQPQGAAPPQPDPQHVADTMAFATQSAQQLLAADPAARPAMAAQIKQAALARQIPEPAIDANLADLSTPGLQAKLADLQAHSAHMAGVMGAQGAPGATPPPLATGGYPWANALLGDPGMQAGLGLLKHFGYDMTGLNETAKAIQAPAIQQAAEVAAAGPKAAAQQAAEIGALPQRKAIEADLTPPVPGASPTYDVNGNHVGWHMPDGSLQAVASTAGAKSGGEAAGAAPSKVMEANLPSGATVQGTWAPGPNGNYIFTPIKGGSGAPEGLGTTPTLATKTDIPAQATALANAATEAQKRLPQYPSDIARGQALLGVANAVGTGAYTKALADLDRFMPGSSTKYAASADLLGADLQGTFRQALGGIAVPRITSEAKAITGQIPKNTAPQDQVKIYAAGLLAATQYQQAHDKFLEGWAEDTSKPRQLSAAENAWQTSPQGRASLFSMPAYQNLTVGGKPAVDTFHYGGRSYLAPFPGILGSKPTLIPVG